MEKEIEKERSRLRSLSVDPLPLIRPLYTNGLRIYDNYWSWKNPHRKIALAFKDSNPIFLHSLKNKLYLLRDITSQNFHQWSGRLVEVSVEDYIFWSLMEPLRRSWKEPQTKEFISEKRFPTDKACVECVFSINQCAVHDL